MIFYIILCFIVTDSLHGRRIVRALWDYYKVDGVISDTEYLLKRRVTPTELDREGPGEATFSMLKLKEVARQREIFSSMESFTSDGEESESELKEGEEDDFSDDSDDYSYGHSDDDLENRGSSFSSVWRQRRRQRRYEL